MILNKTNFQKNLTQQWPLLLCLLATIFGVGLLDNKHFAQKALIDSSHAFIFFLSCLICLNSLDDNRRKTIAGVVIIWMLIGLAIELLQPLVGRNRSIVDLAYNALGCLGAAATFHVYKTGKLPTILPVTLLISLSLFEPGIKSYQLFKLHSHFPNLFAFEDNYEQNFWQLYGQSKGKLVSTSSSLDQSKNVLHLSLEDGKYPGISFQHFYEDWSEHGSLYLRIFSQDSQRITLRIHDRQHNHQYRDRFNKSLPLEKGWNNITIPLEEIASAPKQRRLDLSSISNFALFAVRPSKSIQLQLDEIGLK